MRAIASKMFKADILDNKRTDDRLFSGIFRNKAFDSFQWSSLDAFIYCLGIFKFLEGSLQRRYKPSPRREEVL